MRKCIVAGRLHYFHKWIETSHLLIDLSVGESPGGVVKQDGALVEDVRTGECITCLPSQLRFVDIPEGEKLITTNELIIIEGIVVKDNE